MAGRAGPTSYGRFCASTEYPRDAPGQLISFFFRHMAFSYHVSGTGFCTTHFSLNTNPWFSSKELASFPCRVHKYCIERNISTYVQNLRIFKLIIEQDIYKKIGQFTLMREDIPFTTCRSPSGSFRPSFSSCPRTRLKPPRVFCPHMRRHQIKPNRTGAQNQRHLVVGFPELKEANRSRWISDHSDSYLYSQASRNIPSASSRLPGQHI